ncbi:4-alpha-glucanotransferase, partial [Salmonella enterica subsp. enterica serovar Montevideo]|nr:4-alpha-glucanotransferase [Salmonella enterica subsp. enterica serovar Montevideo]
TYEPFIDLLRANMQNCGALRIDHVMSLLRLWWIPYGETADRGDGGASGFSTVISDTSNFMVRLNALEKSSQAYVLSQPSVVTLN